MAIPTGPFPAPLEFADLRAGMHVRVVLTYHSSGESLTADLWVSRVDATGAYATTPDVQIADPITWNDPTRDEALYLLDAFTGNPDEPATGSVVKAATGTIYQRVTDPADPTGSEWYAPNATTPMTWTDITDTGPATVILDGGTQ